MKNLITHTKFIDCPRCPKDALREQCGLCKGTGQAVSPEDQLCNMCGGKMCHEYQNKSGKWAADVPHGLYEETIIGGYESYHLFDMTAYTFSLCEECLRKMFVQFKIKPAVHDVKFPMVLDANSDYEKGEERSWEDDFNSYEYRVWNDYGGHHQAYLDKKCNRVKDCPNAAIYTRLYRDEFTEDSSCEEHKDRYFQKNVHKLVKFIPNVLKPFL